MKRLIAILLLALAGCATTDPRVADYLDWERHTVSIARSGGMPWSAYYSQAYDRLALIPPSAERNIRMSGYAQLVPIARQFEAGQISQAQFDDQRRLVAASAQQQGMQAAQQRAANNAAETANTLAIMRALQPPPDTSFPRTTNCSTYRLGNQLETTCR